MAKSKGLLFYLLFISVFGLSIWLIVRQGATIQVIKFASENSNTSSTHSLTNYDNATGFTSYLHELFRNISSPLSLLLLQIMVILSISRVFGFFFKKIHQPNVIGEILAGIALGPSLLGHFFPDVSGFLFPIKSLPNLQFLSQVGLILFMFIIGMELDVKYLKNKANEAIVISHASIIFPFFLGVGLSYFIYQQYTPAHVAFLPFALFMGIAMSITAFPVLARIVQERGLTKTALGTMALTCAAVDDVTAWCILAAVVAVVKAGNASNALFTISCALIYIATMVYVVLPIMQRAGNIYTSKENLSKTIVAIVFMVLLASAYATEAIGIHALFGAFVAGVVMPQNFQFKKILTQKIEDVSLILLLPLFFVFTGLRTEIGLINSWDMLLLCAGVISVAVTGKLVGSSLAAKVVGQSWKDALSIGVLMNTRGLMELIVLNIGYDLGILSPTMFAIMVIMALITTLMTGPGLHLIDYLFRKQQTSSIAQVSTVKVLMSFGPAKMGSSLLKLAHLLIDKNSNEAQYTAMHITPSTEIHPQEAIMYEKEAFQPVKATAQAIGLSIKIKYRATEDVAKEIVNTANKGNYDLLLVGAAKSVFNENILGGKIRTIIDDADCNVAIFAERNPVVPDKILVMIYNERQHFLVNYADNLLQNKPTVRITLLDINNLQAQNTNLFLLHAEERVTISSHKFIDKSFLDGFDLLMVDIHDWQALIDAKSQWVQHAPSVLILKQAEA